MTRISAGSTLANQFVPPFVVSDSVASNWLLRYNSTLLAFEAFDPDENVVAAGFDEIESQLFANAVGQQTFVLPWVVDTTATNPKASLYITINGVKQHTSTYSLTVGDSTTTVVLGGPATGAVEFIGLQTTGGASIELFTDVGDAVDITSDLSWLAPSEQSLLITLDGIKQDTSAYSISSNAGFTATIVTFVDPPGDGVAIEIVGIITTGEIPASPVNASNLGAGTGVFGIKRQIGENQILDFKSLVAGARIVLSSDDNSITIATDAITFTNTGTGENSTNNATTVDFSLGEALEFRTLVAGNRINIILSGGIGSEILTWTVDGGYAFGGGTTIDAEIGDRLIGVRNTGAPVTVNLLAIAELPEGDTITIKDESGGAGTFNITVTPASENIDGNATHVISTNFGYVTLYSDGTNYFIIAQG